MFILRWLFGKVASHWDLVTWAAGFVWTFIGGAVSGWAARAAGILSQYAPFSWVAAGLVGAFFAAIIFWILMRSYYWLMYARWTRLWSSPGEGVNPLDDNFIRRRIQINDFVSPVHSIVDGKTFDHCELIGPTLVLLQNANFINCQFGDCNFVVVKDNWPVFNATIFKDTNMIICKIYRMTFLITETTVGGFAAMGVPWLSRIPADFNLPVPYPGPRPIPGQQQPLAQQPQPQPQPQP